MQVHASMGSSPVVTLDNGRSHTWVADEPTDLGGTDTHATPREQLLGALGSCTALTIRSYCERKGWALAGLESDTELVRGEPLAGGGVAKDRIECRVTVHGSFTPDAQDRVRAIAERCPVHRMLDGGTVITTAVTFAS